MVSSRKIVILLGDGMGDYPIDALGGKTPLAAARTPNMDFLARNGIMGLTRTVPEGMTPGSDTANLSVFGYDPSKYYTGRAPLEALNMDIELGPEDVAFRCNLVTIEGGILKDFSADHIDTELTRVVMAEIAENIRIDNIEYYPGVSYRNIVVWRRFPYDLLPATTPPHDIQDMEYENYLPAGNGADLLLDIIERSKQVISKSQKIAAVRKRYSGNPTAVWLWGGGKKPSMVPFRQKYGLSGYTISAVDLIHGIGRALGLSPIRVQGVTGYLDTNYEGKASALLNALENSDFVFLHVEAPDESGHEGNLKHKLQAIEDFDEKIVGPILRGLDVYPDYSIMVMPDHFTPLELRTHTGDPVPFVIYHKGLSPSENVTWNIQRGFNERAAAETGIVVDRADWLMDILVSKKML